MLNSTIRQFQYVEMLKNEKFNKFMNNLSYSIFVFALVAIGFAILVLYYISWGSIWMDIGYKWISISLLSITAVSIYGVIRSKVTYKCIFFNCLYSICSLLVCVFYGANFSSMVKIKFNYEEGISNKFELINGGAIIPVEGHHGEFKGMFNGFKEDELRLNYTRNGIIKAAA